MSKKLFSGLMLTAALLFLFPAAARADMGPKPSVSLTFSGTGDSVYYVTLLSKEQSLGPYCYSTAPINPNSFLVGEHREDDLNAWQAFRGYADADGFFFVDFFKRSNDQNTFLWSYYPPDTFKVLIYYPAENRFVSSGVLQKYAFHSYFRVSAAGNPAALTAEKSYDYSAEMISLLVRIILTAAVEILIALPFGLRKQNVLLFVAAVNIVTQIILNLLLNLIHYSSGGLAYLLNYVWMELLVMVTEAIIFSVRFRKAETEKPIKKWIAPVYSAAANTASFAVGLLISRYLPGIF